MRIRIREACFSALVATVVLPSPAVAQQMRPAAAIPAKDIQFPSPREKSFALVIGNHDYKFHQKLPGARDDVAAVKKALEEFHRFKVTTHLDLGRDKLEPVLKEWLIEKGQDPEARLIVWFAGHGATITLAGREHGYILPIDAPRLDNSNQGLELRKYAVDFESIRALIKNVQARHLLVIFDSCFSGSFLRRRGNAYQSEEFVLKNWASPVHHFITSGTSNQSVPDRSIFREIFVKAITGEAPRPRVAFEGYLQVDELMTHLAAQMQQRSGDGQTPVHRRMAGRPEMPMGQFVFEMSPTVKVSTEKGPGWSRGVFRGGPASKDDVFAKCVVGQPLPSAVATAAMIATALDLKKNKMVHAWTPPADDVTRQKTAGAAPQPLIADYLTGPPGAPRNVHTIIARAGRLHLEYGTGGEMIVVPVVEPDPARARIDGQVLLQGGFTHLNGYGCVEYRFDIQTLTGAGRWWKFKRNRWIPENRFSQKPWTSTLRVEPRMP